MQIINDLVNKIINKLRLFICNYLKIDDKLNEQKKLIDELSETVKKIQESSSVKHNF